MSPASSETGGVFGLSSSLMENRNLEAIRAGESTIPANHNDLGDLTYVVEQSATLQAGGWTEMLRRCPGQTFPSGSLHLMHAHGSDYAMVEFQETIGSQPPSFVRVRLEWNNPP